ncbi:MAG: hypothetical protein OER04_04100 [Cyclobacteriaceae bacterium]|nr:hypothetical protein [Cyclobacteriaceae bacterium]
MNYKVDESTLMAYLYNELGAAEREEVERQLLEDPQAQAQLEEFVKVRTLLGKLEDEEPATPLIMNSPQEKTIIRRLVPWLGVAASVCLLLLAGYATDFRATSQNGQLILGFGEAEPKIEALDQEQVMPLIDQALTRQREQYSQQLTGLQTALENKIVDNKATPTEVRYTQPAPALDEQALQAYLVGYQQQNMQQMAQLLQTNTQIQREELQTFLAEYHQFLEERRLQDLQLIEAGFQAMQDNVNQQKSETEEILANIITSVNSTNY